MLLRLCMCVCQVHNYTNKHSAGVIEHIMIEPYIGICCNLYLYFVLLIFNKDWADGKWRKRRNWVSNACVSQI